MDLGECSRIHELALRADYQKAAKTKDYYYELDVSVCSRVLLQISLSPRGPRAPPPSFLFNVLTAMCIRTYD